MKIDLTPREIQVIYDACLEAIEAGTEHDYETDPAFDSAADKLAEGLAIAELTA